MGRISLLSLLFLPFLPFLPSFILVHISFLPLLFIINDKRLKKWVIKETKVPGNRKNRPESSQTLLCHDLKSLTRFLPALFLKENLEHSALAGAAHLSSCRSSMLLRRFFRGCTKSSSESSLNLQSSTSCRNSSLGNLFSG